MNKQMINKIIYQNIYKQIYISKNTETNKKVIILVTELMTSGSLKG